MNWLPPNGALHGVAFDHLLGWNLAAMFWLFVLTQALIVLAIALALLRRRRPQPAAAPVRARSFRVFLFAELLPLLVIIALYSVMISTSHHLWIARREQPNARNAVQVEVTGVQFAWYFRYPGDDGIFGRLIPGLVNAPAGNPLGLDPNDPHSRDDIVSSTLVLPAGRPVDLRLRSMDVIHGFFIPGMRLKQDCIPGMSGHLQFTPEVPGVYPILCTQVCGLGHGRMQTRLRVVSDADFRRWLAARERIALATPIPDIPAPSPAAPGASRP
jgi:cytochrome c oxidase subunit 2